MNEAQHEVMALLRRVFADEFIEPAERVELRTFWGKKNLSAAQVAEVLEAFVEQVWTDVIADGVVTEEERRRLAALVDGLYLPDEMIPEVVRRALGE